ncbi:hypothetical protein ACHAXN_001108, partial [Cyclotella atomus]
MQLWTPGCPPRFKGKNGVFTICKENALQTAAGGELHANILSCLMGVGIKRVVESFVQYCINNPHVSERSNKLVDMKKMNTTVDKINDEMQKTITLQSSTEAADFDDRWFDKSKLMTEIDKLIEIEHDKKDHGDERVVIDKPGNNSKKSAFVSALVAGQQKMFDKYPNMRKEIIRDIKRDYINKGISTRESREELMMNTLFALSAS